VVLDSALIRYANPFSKIQTTCPHIISLDLSRNLFPDLQTVAEICSPLRHLQSLRLTGNRFSDFEITQGDAFERIEWLALNMCALTWEEVVSLCEVGLI
jgi:hypothetical protein